MILAVALLGVSALLQTGDPHQPEIPGAPAAGARYEKEIREAESLGRRIYEQDQLAWKATDVLLAAVDLRDEPDLVGWINVERDGVWVVRFVGKYGESLRAKYEIPFPRSPAGVAGALVRLDPPKALPDREVGMFKARQAAIEAMPRRCTENSNTVVLPDGERSGWIVYLLSATSAPGKVVIGGHFRAQVAADGSEVKEMRPLSASCLEMDAPPRDAVGLAVTQILSPIPFETHVFLSLLHGVPLLVGTTDDIWLVKEGRITHVSSAPRDEGAAEGPEAP